MDGNVNLCICCGHIIPEGRMVCPDCEALTKDYPKTVYRRRRRSKKPHAKKPVSVMETIFVKGFDTMKEIILTMVAMLILIACGVLQIIGCIFRLVALATGKVWYWLNALCEKLSLLYYRIKGDANSDVIEQAQVK